MISPARAKRNRPGVRRGKLLAGAALVLLLGAVTSVAMADAVTVHVQDASGKPLENAAVYAEPVSGQMLPAPKSLKPVEIEQKHRTFLPLVTVIQVGTDISFPNHDTVRHHVYSFSPAKTFEIKLYSGSGKSEHFDKAGTVVVGCNIHDQMAAYIHIVPTPYFAKTDASGNAVLDGLVPGQYRLKAWHYNLPPGAPIPEQALDDTGGGSKTASFTLTLKAAAAIH